MTVLQEEQCLEEYRRRIAEGLRKATAESYRELAAVCMEDRYELLSGYDRELLLFGRVMSIWLRENAADYPAGETVIGRTAAFWELRPEEVTAKQLTEVYTILKFSFFRLSSDLPAEDKLEGVGRVLALGLTPVAILYAAELETPNKAEAIAGFVSMLERPELPAVWPEARRLAIILRGVTKERQE